MKTRILRFLWALIPWLLVVLILAFVVIMVGRINEKKARLVEAKKAAIKKDIEPVSTIVLTLEPRRLVDKIELPGQVEPYEDLWVKAEVSGQVMKVLVEEGQIVTEGAVLVELDERDYRTRLARIEANYSLAKLDHERTATLVQKKVTPVSELDRIEAQLKDLASQLNEAKLALSRTKITAPIPGRVNEVTAKTGELLAVGQPVAEVGHRPGSNGTGDLGSLAPGNFREQVRPKRLCVLFGYSEASEFLQQSQSQSRQSRAGSGINSFSRSGLGDGHRAALFAKPYGGDAQDQLFRPGRVAA